MSLRRPGLWAVISLALIAGACRGGERTGEMSGRSPAGTETPPATPAERTSGSPSASAFAGRLIKISVQAGTVSPRPGSVDVSVGDRVRLEVTSDVADEVHVHAYDKKVDVRPGETAVLEFVAEIPGSFEVELERSKLQLFELTVR